MGCPNLLWARVQLPRWSIPTASGRLEGGGTLVLFCFLFPFSLIFSFCSLVFA
jgi:hypothetical protein